jgi:hypothetical protein
MADRQNLPQSAEKHKKTIIYQYTPGLGGNYQRGNENGKKILLFLSKNCKRKKRETRRRGDAEIVRTIKKIEKDKKRGKNGTLTWKKDYGKISLNQLLFCHRGHRDHRKVGLIKQDKVNLWKRTVNSIKKTSTKFKDFNRSEYCTHGGKSPQKRLFISVLSVTSVANE